MIVSRSQFLKNEEFFNIFRRTIMKFETVKKYSKSKKGEFE